jgi:UDP-N-acetylglucosamine--N-acetylmuramyl-(pentapeptide) pyrophosphoryl-undecaprenol N-acetylglucosamine transferase
MPMLIIAAGGTGGHMFPAQAIAESLVKQGWTVALSTDPRGAKYATQFPDAVTVRVADAARMGAGILSKLKLPAQLIKSVLSERAWMRSMKPDVVIGLGGYPSFPALSAARLLGIPSLIHEQNSVLGRVNRMFASSVETILCGLPLIRHPKKASVVVTGNPLRQSVLDAVTEYDPPQADGVFNVLCFGGSQGASVFATLIPQVISFLPQSFRARLSLTLQVPESEKKQVQETLQQYGLHGMEVAPFFKDLPKSMAKAHLVIARGGASTLAEITAMGRPSFIIPLPNAMDDHQTANAQTLAQVGAATVYPQHTLTPERLAQDIMKLSADDLKKMATSAKTLGKVAATEHLVMIIKSMVKEKTV